MKRTTARKVADSEELVLSQVLKLLYEKRKSEYDLFDFLVKIHEILKNEKVISIEHIGGNSLGLGDIKCVCEKKTVYIETKFGKDTLANIGEDSLTSEGVFPKALSWSEFRLKKKFDNTLERILEKHNLRDRQLSKRSERADLVRELKIQLGIEKNTEPVLKDIIVNNKKGKNIALDLMRIIELANENKKEYIEYLSTQQIDQEKVMLFFNSISSGITPNKRAIPEKNYEYYYLTPKTIKKISKDNLEGKKDKFNITFDKQHLEISNGKEVIRVVFHWKNVMQGIQTPCLNLFRSQVK